MTEIRCEECGAIIPIGEKTCPDCGCPVREQTEATAQNKSQSQQDDSYKTVSELFWSCEFYKVFRGSKFDLAQRIYEVGALWWETICVWWKCFTKKFATFSGRATRREFFSFVSFGIGNPIFILSLYLIIGFIPFFAVSVRRLHDINRSGWWVLIPIVEVFFLFKKSDEGINDYGKPSDFI